MPEGTQPQSTVQMLPEGFVVRSRDGRLKIVRSGRLEPFTPGAGVGLQRSSEETVAPRVVPAPMSPYGLPTEDLPEAERSAEGRPPVVEPLFPTEPTPVMPVSPSAPPASPIPSYQTPTPSPAPPAELPAQLTPHKPISTSDRPIYFVEPEDEQDIAVHRERIQQFAPAAQPVIDLDRVVASIVQRNSVQFADEVMQKRFYQVVRSRLIEMRNSSETEEALLRSPKIGGMGFEEGLVRRLLVDIEEEAQGIVSQGTLEELQERFRAPASPPEPETPYKPTIPFPTPHPSVPPPPERPVEAPTVPPSAFTHLILARKEAAVAEPPPSRQTPEAPVAPRPTPPPVEVQPIAPSPALRPVERVPEGPSVAIPITETSSAPAPAPPAQAPVYPEVPQAPMPINRPETVSSRPRVTDIIQAPTKHAVMGPVDELAAMTLEDFRRYGSSIEEQKNKILSMIELLEEESYAKRFAGIKAWRRSPVFQLYLDMGRRSIELNQPISEVTADRASKQQETLTSEEFEAIADMNVQLRY